MKNNFVIIGCRRTKSNLLVNSLRQHPQIYCHGELFNPEAIYFHKKYAQEALSPQESFIQDEHFRAADPTGFIERVFAYQQHIPDQIIGFKLLFYQHPTALAYLCQLPRVKKIIPIRNLLYTYTSYQIAQQTQQWTLRAHEQQRSQQIVFDPLAFLRYYQTQFINYVRLIRHLQAQRQPYLINFADSFPSKQSMYDIFEFLELPQLTFPIKEWLIRQNPRDVLERVTNREKLQTKLRGTFLEPLLVGEQMPDKAYWQQNPLDESWIRSTLQAIVNLQKKWKS